MIAMKQASSSRPGSVLKTGLRSDRGQALVEFALVIIFLMIMVFSILEMILLMNTYNVLADSAKEGVRYAIVHGTLNNQPMPASCTSTACSCPCVDIDGPPAPAGTVAGYGSTYGVVSGMTVTVTYPGGDATPANKTPNLVRVVVSYPYQWLFGLSWPTATINAAAEGRIMN